MADKVGNLKYGLTARNFNPLMAMAAEVVIAEVEKVIDGYLDPDDVMTPGIFIKYDSFVGKGIAAEIWAQRKWRVNRGLTVPGLSGKIMARRK